jgi:hypothetical protein
MGKEILYIKNTHWGWDGQRRKIQGRAEGREGGSLIKHFPFPGLWARKRGENHFAPFQVLLAPILTDWFKVYRCHPRSISPLKGGRESLPFQTHPLYFPCFIFLYIYATGFTFHISPLIYSSCFNYTICRYLIPYTFFLPPRKLFVTSKMHYKKSQVSGASMRESPIGTILSIHFIFHSWRKSEINLNANHCLISALIFQGM